MRLCSIQMDMSVNKRTLTILRSVKSCTNLKNWLFLTFHYLNMEEWFSMLIKGWCALIKRSMTNRKGVGWFWPFNTMKILLKAFSRSTKTQRCLLSIQKKVIYLSKSRQKNYFTLKKCRKLSILCNTPNTPLMANYRRLKWIHFISHCWGDSEPISGRNLMRDITRSFISTGALTPTSKVSGSLWLRSLSCLKRSTTTNML